MNPIIKIRRAIEKTKQVLISMALIKGLYENFGQSEVRKIKDKFNYNNLVYGSFEEREQAQLIQDFNEWAYNFDDNDLNHYR